MTLPNVHYHVHSHIGGGYLCECDSHYPIATVAERDRAMIEEKRSWREYIDDGPADSRMVIVGNKSDGYVVKDHDAISWERYVDWFDCYAQECLVDESDIMIGSPADVLPFGRAVSTAAYRAVSTAAYVAVQDGKVILEADAEGFTDAQLRAHMDAAQYWPNVWNVNDHGNVSAWTWDS